MFVDEQTALGFVLMVPPDPFPIAHPPRAAAAVTDSDKILSNVRMLLQRWEEVAANHCAPGESLNTAKHNIKELRDTLQGKLPWLQHLS
jgi:hypothetical protein